MDCKKTQLEGNSLYYHTELAFSKVLNVSFYQLIQNPNITFGPCALTDIIYKIY